MQAQATIQNQLIHTITHGGLHSGHASDARGWGPIAELILKVGIAAQMYYRWKAKYVGLEVEQVRQIKQLREPDIGLALEPRDKAQRFRVECIVQCCTG